MKKFLILLCVCLMCACNKPQIENKQEELPPQNTQQTEQPKPEESPKPVPQIEIVSQTEENQINKEEQIPEKAKEDLEKTSENETTTDEIEEDESCTRRDYTPICKAISAGDLQAVKNLIKDGENIKTADTCTFYGCEGELSEDSVITLAISIGNLDIVKELIKAGADVNKKHHTYIDYASEGGDDFYYTPLYLAIIRKHKKDIAEELIKAGADVDAIDTNNTNDNGKTILELTNDPEITQMLLKYGAKDTPLAALVHNDLEKFTILLKTATQEEKDAALIKTVQDNNISALQELIKAGADINVNIDLHPYPDAGCINGTPLSVALDKEYTEIATLLKKHGAKDTMCAAIEGQNLQRVKYVIQQGTDPNKAYNYCWPFDCGDPMPMYRTIDYGNAEIVKELIKGGVNVDATLYGRTALDYAKVKGKTEIIELLKAAGAKESIKD